MHTISFAGPDAAELIEQTFSRTTSK